MKNGNSIESRNIDILELKNYSHKEAFEYLGIPASNISKIVSNIRSKLKNNISSIEAFLNILDCLINIKSNKNKIFILTTRFCAQKAINKKL